MSNLSQPSFMPAGSIPKDPVAPVKVLAPVRYADLSKKTSDLLSNDYCYDKKFKLTTKSATGTVFTAEGTLSKVRSRAPRGS